jgi:radical SAM protein with 4Fe4S-binding SPASM domain
LNELLIGRLIRSLNIKRIINLFKTFTSFLLSALLKRSIVWGVPSILTIEPTNICNLRCPLCTTGAGEMVRPDGRMTIETFQMIMDKLGDEIFFLLIYHQGEPYLNKDFFEFVRLAKNKKIYVTTSTNGHYLSPSTVQQTIDCGLDSMIISLDGTTQESFEHYRRGGNLGKVIDGVKLLTAERKKRKSRTPNVAIQFLVMKHNEIEIPLLRPLVKELGADRLLLKNIEVHSASQAREWLPAEEKYRRYNFDGQNLVVKNADKKYCSRPWLSTLINWDGSVVPCCFDKNGTYTMGILQSNGPFERIWSNEPFNRFRGKLITQRKSIDICSNCNQGIGNFLPGRYWKRRNA